MTTQIIELNSTNCKEYSDSELASLLGFFTEDSLEYVGNSLSKRVEITTKRGYTIAVCQFANEGVNVWIKNSKLAKRVGSDMNMNDALEFANNVVSKFND